jgi:HSP20 family protein
MNGLMMSPRVGSLRREMDRLFDRLWEGDELATMGEWNPSMDLSETKDMLEARIEVPGIEPNDIHVNLENGILTVKGEKTKETEKEDERFYRMERSYGSFMRSLRLPVAVDASKVNATFKNGLLTVTMPKAPEARGTEIPVKS